MKKEALITAVGTAIAGFGAMNIFWAFEAPTTVHRGLYSYLSASIGDALCLPVIAGALTAARMGVPAAPHARGVGLAAAAVAMAATTATQASWLADPRPDLNWTLPAPHTFNAAGWYHAAFSVGFAGFVGYLLGQLGVRLRAHGLSRASRRAIVTAIAAGVGFGVLLTLDNLPNLDRAASRSSIALLAGTGAVMAAAGIFVATRRVSD